MTQVADTLTWMKGRHTLKPGADLRWERVNQLTAAQLLKPYPQYTTVSLYRNDVGSTITTAPT